MAEIVLRVRLVGGDHLDVTYDKADAAAGDVVEHIISALAEDGGTLRCRHGDRLIVLYGRGVATVEVAPAARSCRPRPGGFSRTARQQSGWPAMSHSVPASRRRSDRADLLGLRALGPADCAELDPLVFPEASSYLCRPREAGNFFPESDNMRRWRDGLS